MPHRGQRGGIKRLSKITGQQMRVEHDGEVIEGSFISVLSQTLSLSGRNEKSLYFPVVF